MKKAFSFFKEKNNREVISWFGSGCIAVGGLVFGALNFFNPNFSGSSSETEKAAATPNVVAAQCSKPEDIITFEGGFVFSDSHERALGLAEIVKLTKCQRWVARNEIYARKGRFFSHPMLKKHFASQAWYSPQTPFPGLSELEELNVGEIRAHENRQ